MLKTRIGPNQSQGPETRNSIQFLPPVELAGTQVRGLSSAVSLVHKKGTGWEIKWPGLEPALHSGCGHPK